MCVELIIRRNHQLKKINQNTKLTIQATIYMKSTGGFIKCKVLQNTFVQLILSRCLQCLQLCHPCTTLRQPSATVCHSRATPMPLCTTPLPQCATVHRHNCQAHMDVLVSLSSVKGNESVCPFTAHLIQFMILMMINTFPKLTFRI